MRKICTTCGKKVLDNEFAAEMHWITKGHYPAGEDFTYQDTSERWAAKKAERDAQKNKDTPDA